MSRSRAEGEVGSLDATGRVISRLAIALGVIIQKETPEKIQDPADSGAGVGANTMLLRP